MLSYSCHASSWVSYILYHCTATYIYCAYTQTCVTVSLVTSSTTYTGLVYSDPACCIYVIVRMTLYVTMHEFMYCTMHACLLTLKCTCTCMYIYPHLYMYFHVVFVGIAAMIVTRIGDPVQAVHLMLVATILGSLVPFTTAVLLKYLFDYMILNANETAELEDYNLILQEEEDYFSLTPHLDPTASSSSTQTTAGNVRRLLIFGHIVTGVDAQKFQPMTLQAFGLMVAGHAGLMCSILSCAYMRLSYTSPPTPPASPHYAPPPMPPISHMPINTHLSIPHIHSL